MLLLALGSHSRTRLGGDFGEAKSRLLAAGRRIGERELANAGRPIEKLVFRESGPLKALVGRNTDK